MVARQPREIRDLGSGMAVDRAEGRGMGVEFGGRGKVGADRELVQVGAEGFEVADIVNGVADEGGLPEGEFAF